MRILLDTHILFWSMCMEQKLPQRILSWINAPENAKAMKVPFAFSSNGDAFAMYDDLTGTETDSDEQETSYEA